MIYNNNYNNDKLQQQQQLRQQQLRQLEPKAILSKSVRLFCDCPMLRTAIGIGS